MTSRFLSMCWNPWVAGWLRSTHSSTRACFLCCDCPPADRYYAVGSLARGEFCMSEDEAFFSKLADATAAEPVSAAEIDAVLDFTRVVAHTQERRYAPVASYALGLALGAADP